MSRNTSHSAGVSIAHDRRRAASRWRDELPQTSTGKILCRKLGELDKHCAKVFEG
jgi:hypothetical protein